MARRHRRRQPSPVLRRPGGARQRAWRNCCRASRSRSSTRRTSSPKPACSSSARTLGTGAADRLRARHAGRRPAAGARPGALAGARRRLRSRRARAAPGRAGRDRRGARQRSSCAGPSAAAPPPCAPALARVARRPATRRWRRSTRCSEIAPDFVRLHERAARLAQLARRASPSGLRGRPRALGRPAAQQAAPGRVAARHPRARCASRWRSSAARRGSSRRPRWATTSACAGSPSRPASTMRDVLRLGSPFDYARRRRVFVPRLFPKPSDRRPYRRGRRARRALRQRARRAHVRADDDAARAAARSATQLRVEPRRGRRADRGAGAGPVAEAPADAALPRRRARAVPGRLAELLGRRRRARATRCSA